MSYEQQKASLNTLKWAYITAFVMIAVLATIVQGIVQYALVREGTSRQAAAVEARQSIRSQRIGRDSILLLTPVGNYQSTVHELQADLAGQEQDRMYFTANYASNYPEFAAIDGGHGRGLAIYLAIRKAAFDELRIVGESTSLQKLDASQRTADVRTIFFAQPEQLSNIQAAQAIIDADTDATIAHIRLIEIILYAVTVLVLVLEAVFVLMPAVKYFYQMAQPEIAMEPVLEK